VEKRIVITADSDIDQDKVQTLNTRRPLSVTQYTIGALSELQTVLLIDVRTL